MIIRKGDIVELWIENLAFGGSGVARLNGFVIFVRGGVPGDRLLAQVMKKRKDYAESFLLEIISPSPERVTAPCQYSGFCGGCQWQYLRYDSQLKYKREHLEDSINRIGGISNVRINDIIPSEKIYGYRNKMEFSFSDRKWLLPDEYSGNVKTDVFGLGLHAPGTFYKIIDIKGCLLQHEQGNRILREVRKFVSESEAPAYNLKMHKGFWRFLTLRYSEAYDEWMINIVTPEEKNKITKSLAERLCDKFHNISTVVNNINRKKAAIAFGEEEKILKGKGYIMDRIGGYSFRISANSFFQTNSTGAGKLYDTVAKYADLDGSEIVLDLYSGTGTIPLFISGKAKEVIGMEIMESAINDAEQNCLANNVQNCRFIHGDIRENLSSIKIRPDVLVIDPPRSGMHKDVLSSVMDMETERIVYVSCNPSTLARDLGQLSQKYDIMEIQPFDMFPHTYHIESVAKLVKRR